MNANLEKLTAHQVARLLNVGVRHVYRLADLEVIPRKGVARNARYVWNDVLAGYIKHLLKDSGRNSKKEADSVYEKAELRRVNVDIRLKELKAAELEGKMVSVEEVQQAQAQVNSNIRGRLLALPSKLTPQLLGVSSPAKVKAILEKETRATCEELVTAAIPEKR